MSRKGVLLRLDPAVHDALARWAADELRSTNAQIEFLLRRALAEEGRMPASVGRLRRPGRPRAAEAAEGPAPAARPGRPRAEEAAEGPAPAAESDDVGRERAE